MEVKLCGYSFWGYLGDIKYDRKGNKASTPDGNAFYSWCIIRELQKRGYNVVQVMPDRDEQGYKIHGDLLFASWGFADRLQAYIGTKKIPWYEVMDMLRDTKFRDKAIIMTKEWIYDTIKRECKDMEFILHEYRMLIPGRNDEQSILDENWQPDYMIQECLIKFCCEYQKRLILFDLDYKLDFGWLLEWNNNLCPISIIELGTKWQDRFSSIIPYVPMQQVYIPFDFDYINVFDVDCDRPYNLVYVGNRYERDWCIDKYIPSDLDKCIIYGNWLESARDSHKRWPNLKFGQRLQTFDMRNVYGSSVATILLAKEEYCQYGFMTARIIESIFYGTVPLFIEEYGEKLIEQYAGDYAKFLTVRSKEDVCRKVNELREMSDGAWVEVIIEYLRDRLKFMDVKNFVDILMEVK